MRAVKKALISKGLPGSLIAVLGLTACGVSQELYNTRTTELDKCQSELSRTQGDLVSSRSSREDLDKQVDELSQQRNRLSDENMKLKSEQVKLGDTRYKATQKEMDELRRVHELAERRFEVYQLLSAKLGSLISGNTVVVDKPHNKQIVVRINDELLFDPGKAELKSGGIWALRQVASTLKLVHDRDFLVAGHTDNTSVRGSPYRSNWDLSAARAVSVVRFFQSEGVDPRRLSAAGYSEFGPIGDNATADRAKNRRIDVVIMPRIEELPSILEPVDGGVTD